MLSYFIAETGEAARCGLQQKLATLSGVLSPAWALVYGCQHHVQQRLYENAETPTNGELQATITELEGIQRDVHSQLLQIQYDWHGYQGDAVARRWVESDKTVDNWFAQQIQHYDDEVNRFHAQLRELNNLWYMLQNAEYY